MDVCHGYRGEGAGGKEGVDVGYVGYAKPVAGEEIGGGDVDGHGAAGVEQMAAHHSGEQRGGGCVGPVGCEQEQVGIGAVGDESVFDYDEPFVGPERYVGIGQGSAVEIFQMVVDGVVADHAQPRQRVRGVGFILYVVDVTAIYHAAFHCDAGEMRGNVKHRCVESGAFDAVDFAAGGAHAVGVEVEQMEPSVGIAYGLDEAWRGVGEGHER